MAFKSSSLNPDELIKSMGDVFDKLPALPKSVRDFMVKLAPWLALIFGVLGVVLSIAATGFLTVLSPLVLLGGGFGVAAGGIIGSVLALISSVLLLMAYPGLRDNKMAGWRWLFWSEAVSIVSSVVALNIFGAIVGALVGFYLLFQIKSYYK